MQVDFPDPLEPITAANSPAAISKSIPRNACLSRSQDFCNALQPDLSPNLQLFRRLCAKETNGAHGDDLMISVMTLMLGFMSAPPHIVPSEAPIVMGTATV